MGTSVVRDTGRSRERPKRANCPYRTGPIRSISTDRTAARHASARGRSLRRSSRSTTRRAGAGAGQSLAAASAEVAEPPRDEHEQRAAGDHLTEAGQRVDVCRQHDGLRDTLTDRRREQFDLDRRRAVRARLDGDQHLGHPARRELDGLVAVGERQLGGAGLHHDAQRLVRRVAQVEPQRARASREGEVERLRRARPSRARRRPRSRPGPAWRRPAHRRDRSTAPRRARPATARARCRRGASSRRSRPTRSSARRVGRVR